MIPSRSSMEGAFEPEPEPERESVAKEESLIRGVE